MKIYEYPVPDQINGMVLEEELRTALGIEVQGGAIGVGVSIGVNGKLLVHVDDDVDDKKVIDATLKAHKGLR